ncbi:MAG: hypothetical protein HY951_13940 [Bacteroidia bacterium]|nr:hypothetical protein [Bacteroidia bacterium]
MKKVFLLCISVMLSLCLFAQTPQSFQYQAVVRDLTGTILINQSVNFQISILSGSITGTVEYIETHAASSNAFGIVNLNIGTGTPVQGTFSGIIWGSASHFIKVEADPTGGTNYLDMGTTQLLSVPYALYSEKAGNIPTYTGGNGIDITGITISNTAPDQTITLSQSGATTVSGTYPNFTISSTDLNMGTPGGLNKTVQFNNAGVFDGDTAMIWDNANKRLGVGTTAPNGRMIVQGSTTASPGEPLFEVKNASGQSVFVVYPDSVHVYIKDGGAKSNRGGFAVSGRNNAKGFTNHFLSVTPDSTRIFTGDPSLGFGVEDLGGGSSTSYMNITPLNYFIGHQSGDSITTGMYNSCFGYQAGKNLRTSQSSIFIGYQAGLNTDSSHYNVFIGNNAGFMNTKGDMNVAIGNSTGYSNTTGRFNTFVGNTSGSFNSTGSFNTFVGQESGILNTTGENNTYVGQRAGYNNINGNDNFAGGSLSLYNMQSGSGNVAAGTACGFFQTSGNNNLYLGNYCGFSKTSGDDNVFVGSAAGLGNSSGSRNVFIGNNAGQSETGSDLLYIDNSSTPTPLIYGDFVQNKVTINDLLNLAPRFGAPAAPLEGDVYVNAADHHIYCYLNGIWKQLD